MTIYIDEPTNADWIRKLTEQLTEQQEGPTPRGQPLPPWEGQVEITAEDVAEAIIRWNQDAEDEFKGLLETEVEEPEGGEVEEEAGA